LLLVYFKQAYPLLLVGALKILQQEHKERKRNLHSDASGVVRERLKELQEKAKLYTSFAASVGIANVHIGKLTEIASLMI